MKFEFFKKALMALAPIIFVMSVQAAQPGRQPAKFSTIGAEAAIKDVQNAHGFLRFMQRTQKLVTSAPTFEGAVIAGSLGSVISTPIMGFLFRDLIENSSQSISAFGVIGAVASCWCVGLSVFIWRYWQSAEMMCWRAANKFNVVCKQMSHDSLLMGDIHTSIVQGYVSQHFNNNLGDAITHYQNISAEILEIQRLLIVASQDPKIKVHCDRLKKEAKIYEIRLAEILTLLRNRESIMSMQSLALANPAAVQYQVRQPAVAA